MRILLAYPGHLFSTYDVAKGYERALTRLGHEVRVFDYHMRLWFYGEALAHAAEINPGFKRRPSDTLIMASEAIILEAVEFVPEIVVMVHGMSLHRRAYDLLHRLRLPVVQLLTESPYLDESQAMVASKAHLVGLLTNDLASEDALKEATGLPVRYLPHSYDKERHRPRPVASSYFRHDVFFHGTLWPERQRAFLPLSALQGVDMQLGGIMPKDGVADLDDIMPNDELATHYAGSKICLNHHRTIISGQPDEDAERHIPCNYAQSLGPRAYEIAACGAFQLSDDRPELHAVFNGSVPVYEDGDHLLELVRYYLAHDAERERLAAAAHEAVQGCSFDDRARDILIPFLQEVANGSTV